MRARSLAGLADRVGAHRSADRLHRLRGADLVGVDLPATRGGRLVRVRFQRHDGRDQVARAIEEGGLWGFEPPLVPLFVELCRHSYGEVVDVGANTGLYSLLAVAANRRVRVHAVEAFPAVADHLRENLALNRSIARRVRVHQVALSDGNGSASLYVPPPTGTPIETSASLDPTFKEEIASEIEVPTRTLDDLWDASARPAVGLIKVDTEGTEHRVLRGAEAVLATNRPVVICEVLPRAATTELTERLARTDYVDIRLRRDVLVIGTRVVFDPDAWNHAFVPEERLLTVEAAGRAIGLGSVDRRSSPLGTGSQGRPSTSPRG